MWQGWCSSGGLPTVSRGDRPQRWHRRSACRCPRCRRSTRRLLDALGRVLAQVERARSSPARRSTCSSSRSDLILVVVADAFDLKRSGRSGCAPKAKVPLVATPLTTVALVIGPPKPPLSEMLLVVQVDLRIEEIELARELLVGLEGQDRRDAVALFLQALVAVVQTAAERCGHLHAGRVGDAPCRRPVSPARWRCPSPPRAVDWWCRRRARSPAPGRSCGRRTDRHRTGCSGCRRLRPAGPCRS